MNDYFFSGIDKNPNFMEQWKKAKDRVEAMDNIDGGSVAIVETEHACREVLTPFSEALKQLKDIPEELLDAYFMLQQIEQMHRAMRLRKEKETSHGS